MKILTIGDIVGEGGFTKVKEILPKIKAEEKIDFIIANGENTCGGMGINKKMFEGLLEIGIDVVTMGNHTWAKRDIFAFINHPKLIRPANYSKGLPGNGFGIYECKGKKIAVINLIGRTDMGVLSENPFTVAANILNSLKNRCDYSIVDFHAEATAEKIAMGYYLDGKATIVFGTHTHVQTADETVLPKGTAYITDIGMTGPIHSVIGMDIEASTKRFVTSIPERYKVAEGNCMLNACLFTIEETKKTVEKIEKWNIR